MGNQRDLVGLNGALHAREIEAHLLASRARLLALTRDLEPQQWIGPRMSIVNPALWEIGHVAWFQEYWCLRRAPDDSLGASIIDGADALYDSNTVEHLSRWTIPLLPVVAAQRYLGQVLERTLERLAREPDDARVRYFASLAAHHEDMHCEALHYTRQTLGYAPPALGFTAPTRASTAAIGGDVAIPGGTFMLGAYPEAGFVFDNEKWAHEVTLAPYKIARTTVTNAEFRLFVEAGGYRNRAFWSADGWAWVRETGARAPRYWRRLGEGFPRADAGRTKAEWVERRFDRLERIIDDAPVMNVSYHEAQAYCVFAHRRLPTEAEWECAASRAPARTTKAMFPWGVEGANRTRANVDGAWVQPVDALPDGDSAEGCRQLIGNVWEWTSSTFEPFPGFVRDPYKEYSEPWFGTHKVLRGGSFATPARLIRATWRNFYMPHRSDPFAGFRTCALD